MFLTRLHLIGISCCLSLCFIIPANADQPVPGWPDCARVLNGALARENNRVEATWMPGKGTSIEIGAWEPPQCWTAYEGLFFDVENTSDISVCITIVVAGKSTEGRTQYSKRSLTVPASARLAFPFFFGNGNAGPYWGMRGIPLYGRLTQAGFATPVSVLNLSSVVRVSLEADIEKETTLRIHQAILFEKYSDKSQLVPHPFIDAYGQYKHEDWPGKVYEEEDLPASLEKENALLDAAPQLTDRDCWGGWAAGPKREATGWFRVEQMDGKWWFVTPDGHLFLSLGVNCVHFGNSTFVDGREGWFENLPEAEGPAATFWGHASGAHSLADPIGGKGRTFNHYGMNLYRKYGDDYREQARDMAGRRLRAWGFNTIGNWSEGSILEHSPVPFIVTLGSGGARPLEGSTGYWGKMKDVYDSDFETNTIASIGPAAGACQNNPKVIGFFVDNEMSWLGIARAALDSPEDQPARIAFIAQLQEQYAALDALNNAWGTEALIWNTLKLPNTINGQCRADCDAFEYRFARRYFEIVAAVLHEHAPHHLYLGCRFTPVYCPEPVLRACAEIADVVSINLYARDIPADRYLDLGKPVIIGEFHFGATDRGMFHPGLQSADSQEERAQCYRDYVSSLARHPAFIGAHWFQYTDQPVTGRNLDGENYNIGLVNIVDEPYPELIAAAKDIHQRMYALRWEQ